MLKRPELRTSRFDTLSSVIQHGQVSVMYQSGPQQVVRSFITMRRFDNEKGHKPKQDRAAVGGAARCASSDAKRSKRNRKRPPMGLNKGSTAAPLS